jgi:methionyl-tRNA formyltransferase
MIFSNIIVMGFGKMPSDCIELLLGYDYLPTFVIETEKSLFSPLKNTCKKFRISFHEIHKNRDITGFLENVKGPTIVFSINNNYLFPNSILKRETLKVINFHNSFLPAYKGNGKVVPTWAIFNGEKSHGVTWHLVSAGIDAGNILCQERFPIDDYDTALNVIIKGIILGIKLFENSIDAFFNIKINGIPQGYGEYYIYKTIDIPAKGYLDINWDFETMSRFLRSMDTGPYQILPKPKIILDNNEYIITKYWIDKKNSIEKISQSKLPEKKKQILFDFPKKSILLTLDKRCSV